MDHNLSKQIDALNRDYEDLHDKLLTGPAFLGGFRREIEELYEEYSKSVDNVSEKERMIEKHLSQITGIQDQIATFSRSIEESEGSKETLTKTIDHLNSLANGCRDRESQNTKRSFELRDRITELEEQISQGSGWTEEQESERDELAAQADFVFRKLENQQTLVHNMRKDLEHLQGEIMEKEKVSHQLGEEINHNEDMIADFLSNAQDQDQRKDMLDKKLLELQVLVQDVTEDERERIIHRREQDEGLQKLDQELRDGKGRMDSYLKEYDSLFRETTKLTLELDRQVMVNEGVVVSNSERVVEIEEKEKETRVLQREIVALMKEKEEYHMLINKAEKKRVETDALRDEMTAQIDSIIEVETRNVRKEVDIIKKQTGDLTREKTIIQKRITNAENNAQTVSDLVIVNTNAERNLRNERDLLSREVAELRDQVERLLQQKEKFEQEADIATQKHYTALEELKLQEVQAKELQDRIVSDQAKLKQQQNHYEAVRSDRNLHSKHLVESQEEINGLKRRFKMMAHQIEQMKEQITSRDHDMVKVHFHHHAIDKDKETLKNELTRTKKQITSAEQIIQNQKVESVKLSRIIEEAEVEKQRQEKELETVTSERNLLCAQVMKRNEEVATMYEKIRVQRCNLMLGERQHRSILSNIKKEAIALVCFCFV